MSDQNTYVVHPVTGQHTPAFLNGVVTPMYTPATTRGELDEDGIRSYTDWLIGTGAVTTLFPRSGLGNMYRFSMKQAHDIIDIVSSQADGRIPVMPGCGGMYDGEHRVRDARKYLAESIELCSHAEERGCVAAVVVMPHAILPQDRDYDRQENITLKYYADLTAAIAIPVLAYQPPMGFRRYRPRTEFVHRLISDVPGVIGLKYSTGDLRSFTHISSVISSSGFALIAGDETVFMPAFAVGVAGVIGQGATNNPEVLRAVYERMMSSDYPGAWAASQDVLRGIGATRNYSPAHAGLAYLGRKGVAVGPVTLDGPRTIESAELERIEGELDGVREKYMDNRWWVDER